MKRTILALAVASISFAALAGPPTDRPPVGPVDVRIVENALPFPFYQKITVIKDSDDSVRTECIFVPDTLAYLLVTGLTFDGNANPSFPDSDVLVGATTTTGDYVLFKDRVDEEPVVDLYNSNRERFADFVPVNFWLLAGDKICLTVNSGPAGIGSGVALDLVISGEAY